MILRNRRYSLALVCLVLLLTACKQPASVAPAGSAGNEQAAAPSPSPSPTPPRPSGPIEFTDVTADAGIRFKHNSGAFGKKYLPETIGAGGAFLDYDNDGWQDVFLVNSTDWTESKRRVYSALYRNNKDGTFTDVTQQVGLGVEMYGIGVAVADYDNDGNDDIYVTCVGQNHLFRNLGNGKFADVTAQLGTALTSPWSSRGAAFADFDNDGDVDVAVNNLGTRPSLFRNEGGNHSGNWLLLELVSKTGNRGATGARVTVETEQTRQMQEVTAGNSYQSSNDWRLHFGLGASSTAKSVVIRWPDKQLQTFDGVAANHIYFLKQGGQLAVTEPKRD
jgi:hypothetical protein